MIRLIDDPARCGLGEGEKCCAFLCGNPTGMLCGLTVPGLPPIIRERLKLGTMNAKYDPGDRDFPACQDERKESYEHGGGDRPAGTPEARRSP